MKRFLNLILSIVFALLTVALILIKFDLIHIEFVNPTPKTKDEIINNGLNLNDENLSLSNGREDRFYYNQLSDTAKTIYNKLIDEKEQLKTGTSKIYFTNNEFDKLLSTNNGMTYLSEEYQNAADAIRYDTVDLFYIDFTRLALKTITYTRGDNVSYEVYFSPIVDGGNYLIEGVSEFDVDFVYSEVYKKRDEILENANGSNYQKVLYIHNWLIDNIEYDSAFENQNNRNIYGALIEGKVVCEGYAKAFKFLLDELEIPCILVAGDAVNSEGNVESHMWNYVKINDVWYAVDVTWDDPIILNSNNLPEENRYKYFCQGDNINTNHILKDTITKNSQVYEYPELYHKGEI